jgi:1-acyl-sn-glycerol-3-phosphate acyltransferase
MRWIHSVLFWAFFAASCAVLFFVGLVLFLVTWPFDRNRRVLHLFSCAWAQLYFWVNPGWRLRIEGRERIPWHGPAVVVSNHQSLGDILVLYGLYRPFKWVSKASIFKAPFLGWNMVLNGYVGLVRGDKESIAKMMAECERWLDRGVPVLLFPEGTRSPDNEIKAFKDGAFRLALSKGCPLIPIVLTGTGDTLPKHGLVLKGRANCKVRVLEPMDPRAFSDVATLREHVRDLMIREKSRLDAEVAAELQTA